MLSYIHASSILLLYIIVNLLVVIVNYIVKQLALYDIVNDSLGLADCNLGSYGVGENAKRSPPAGEAGVFSSLSFYNGNASVVTGCFNPHDSHIPEHN